MTCICGLSFDNLKRLHRHFSTLHRDLSFVDCFRAEMLANWEDTGREDRRLFLLKEAEYRCCQCGFSKRRSCGSTILEIDHIDGNHSNNSRENLRVLCPNCHAMTPTYRNWNNKGNKKTSPKVRPGNTGYADRSKAIAERKEERLRCSMQVKSHKKKTQTPVHQELEKIKAAFQKNFIDSVLAFHATGEIDYSKYGWVQILSDRLGEQPQIVGRRVRELLPDFYVNNCYSRTYNRYTRWNKEKIRPDEELALKASAG